MNATPKLLHDQCRVGPGCCVSVWWPGSAQLLTSCELSSSSGLYLLRCRVLLTRLACSF